MRPSNKSRSRNKSGSNQQRRNQMGNIVNRVFESAGPDGKVRGTPQQIIDKYQVLARDAQVSGDRVAAENYLQHAEHYARLLSEAQRQNQERQHERDDRDERDDDREHAERPNAERGERQPEYGSVEQISGGRPDQERREPPAEEPAGLVTFGGEDAGEPGPVDTPESASWSSGGNVEGAIPNGEAVQPAPQAEEAPAPKRTRSRRKTKPAAEVIEASAE